MRRAKAVGGALVLAAGVWLTNGAGAAETPPQGTNAPPPPWKTQGFPVLTVSRSSTAVTVDGVIDLDTEWKDAAILTGFYQKDLNALAPVETQPRCLLKVSDQFLYVAVRSPIYPVGAQLKSFEKTPDRTDSIMAGDHMAVEVLPVKTRDADRISRVGSYALIWNVLGAMSDQHLNLGQPGLEWSSGAKVASRAKPECWETEMALPLESLSQREDASSLSLPPKNGDYWSMSIARRFGKAGLFLCTTWDNNGLTIEDPDTGPAWLKKPLVRFVADAVSVQMMELGDLASGKLNSDIRFFNPGTVERKVAVDLLVQDSRGTKLWAENQEVSVPAGGQASCRPFKADLAIEPRGSQLFIRIVQDGTQTLYVTPGIPLVRLDDSVRLQLRRSLEMLRQP